MQQIKEIYRLTSMDCPRTVDEFLTQIDAFCNKWGVSRDDIRIDINSWPEYDSTEHELEFSCYSPETEEDKIAEKQKKENQRKILEEQLSRLKAQLGHN